MKMRSAAVALLACAAVAPTAASAHHSFAMFDMQKTFTMTGTVKELQWTNPHVWLYVVVLNDKNQPEDWGFEAGPTNSLMRFGWKRDVLKPGDKITLTGHPMRNGSHAGSLSGVTEANGTVLGMNIQGAKPDESEKAK